MKQAPTHSLLNFALFFMRKQWIKFTLIVIFWLAYSLDQTLFPVFFGRIIDAFTAYAGERAEAWSVLGTPILTALFFWFGIEVSFRLGGVCTALTMPNFERQLRMYMVSHLQDQSAAFFAVNFTGTITTKISDMVDNLSHILNMTLTLFVPVIVAVFLSVITFSSLNPVFGALIGVWAIVHIVLSIFFGMRSARRAYIHADTRSRLNGRIVDSITHYLAVKLFAAKAHEMSYINVLQRDERRLNTGQYLYVERVRVLMSSLVFLGPGVALNGYAYWCWVQNLITVGDIVLIFNTSWNIILMLWWASIELPIVFQEIGICRQSLAMLQDPITVKDVKDAAPLKVTKGKIEFENVYFQYKGPSPLFTNKSLVLKAGEKVGLVGYSGSGKSSFANLILRLYDVQGGRILIDGQDIAQVTQQSLREAISVIPQDPSLFHRTLLENIRYGQIDASDEEVIKAAKLAHAHDFITQLPQGYDTLAGEKGVSISGGQRQRIAIARAILKDAPILILDEATSALDAHVESLIQESFEHLMRGKTTLVIAHKLSTLLTMDRILVFDGGRIVADGTHKDLLAQGGVYKILWDTQVDGFLVDAKREG